MAETCPICDGTGWTVVERNGLTGAQRCTCAAQTRVASLRDATNVPPKYENASLDNFQIPQENPIVEGLIDGGRAAIEALNEAKSKPAG